MLCANLAKENVVFMLNVHNRFIYLLTTDNFQSTIL